MIKKNYKIITLTLFNFLCTPSAYSAIYGYQLTGVISETENLNLALSDSIEVYLEYDTELASSDNGHFTQGFFANIIINGNLEESLSDMIFTFDSPVNTGTDILLFDFLVSGNTPTTINNPLNPLIDAGAGFHRIRFEDLDGEMLDNNTNIGRLDLASIENINVSGWYDSTDQSGSYAQGYYNASFTQVELIKVVPVPAALPLFVSAIAAFSIFGSRKLNLG